MSPQRQGIGRCAFVAARQLRQAGAAHIEWHYWGFEASAGQGFEASAGQGFKLGRAFRYMDRGGSLVDAGEVDRACALFAGKAARR